MRFQVPQFIDIEDKIFGPFTFKQFVYLLGGAGGSYVFYKILPLVFAVPLILVVGGVAVALTFLKVNGRPFADALQSSFIYFFRSKLFVWKQAPPKKTPAPQKQFPKQEESGRDIPRLTESKLKDIAWSLDVLEKNKQR